jgi:hypothetical protein
MGRHRQIRQHRRRRTIHSHVEERVHATADRRPIGASRVRLRARPFRRLVQRRASAFPSRGPHSRRGLLQSLPRVPAAAIRAASALAATVSVRTTTRAHSWQTRRLRRAERQLLRQPAASSDRDAPTRRVAAVGRFRLQEPLATCARSARTAVRFALKTPSNGLWSV